MCGDCSKSRNRGNPAGRKGAFPRCPIAEQYFINHDSALAAERRSSISLDMRLFSTLLLVSAAVTATALAQGVPSPFTVAASGRSYATLGDTIRAIGNGRGTVLVAPGSYAHCDCGGEPARESVC